MDLVRELEDVRFGQGVNGYDYVAVDAFLAKLRGDVAALQADNEQAHERIAELEEQLEEGSGTTEAAGTLQRTLLLAQRLADETEAESKKEAAELIEHATEEAESLRAAADADATSMRESAESELADAREEAESIRSAANQEAAAAREDARNQVSAILAAAEERSAERVALVERTAQEEAMAMRLPARTEVGELEGVRSQLLADISSLETHLEEQRVRVRSAVEALRVGMSGSIEDLERVADNEELLAAEAAPEHSGVSADDVEMAPDIAIVDGVDDALPAPPTVEEIERDAIEAMSDRVETVETSEAIEEVGGEFPDLEVIAEEHDDKPGASTAPASVENGPSTEPIPVVALLSEDELADSGMIDLDEEPSALFETDLGEDADATAVVDQDVIDVSNDATVPADVAESGFATKFAEVIDELPVGQNG